MNKLLGIGMLFVFVCLVLHFKYLPWQSATDSMYRPLGLEDAITLNLLKRIESKTKIKSLERALIGRWLVTLDQGSPDIGDGRLTSVNRECRETQEMILAGLRKKGIGANALSSWLLCLLQRGLLRLDRVQDVPPPAQAPAYHIPTFFVVSHQRSGTHLSMDMLHNTFKGPLRVIKTNHVLADKELGCECIGWMQRMGGIIHPYRDVRDMLVSMYYYRQRNDPYVRQNKPSFSDFLLANGSDIIRHWRLTTMGWSNQAGVVNILFSNNVNDTLRHQKVIPALVRAFNLKLNDPEFRTLDRWIFRSKPVLYKAGKGDRGWESIFTAKDLEFVEGQLALSLNTSSLLIGPNACPSVCAGVNPRRLGESRLKGEQRPAVYVTDKQRGRREIELNRMGAPTGCFLIEHDWILPQVLSQQENVNKRVYLKTKGGKG